MNLVRFSFLFYGVFSLNICFSQLTIEIDTIPSNTPKNSTIYVAGDFQGWDPADPAYALTENDGVYSITLSPAAGILNFKFTRGSWGAAEGNQNGGFLPDRTYSYDGSQETLTLQILSWEDTGGSNSSAASNVQILDTEFYIPQLERTRRIWVYLPPDYETTPDKHYPVLYMHDAQNLFDVATSFAGEWEVDETLNELFNQGDYGCIVVGIDNGGEFRLDEYSPWINSDYGGGQGEAYVQFLVNTLKPHIDEEFRTFPEREYTGIMGSSMGGLISLYAGIEYSETFSKIGSFSPAYWFAASDMLPYVEGSTHDLSQKIYTIAGIPEGPSITTYVPLMDAALLESGFTESELSTTMHSDGAHSEWYWAREFRDAYVWLFQDVANSLENRTPEYTSTVYPNPTTGIVSITNATGLSSFSLIDLEGKSLELVEKGNGSFDMSHLPSGIYLLKAQKKEGDSITFRIKKD
ncbi:MAG: alpha/beta hydrolase-fold protein [Flavobacteriales bacterium]